MATDFKLPDLGENIASGDVVTVFVSEGDVVKPGQALLEVETDKAVIEVPCPPGGRIAQVLVKKGDTVKVGQTLVLLDAVGAASASAKPAPQASTQASTQAPPQAHAGTEAGGGSCSRSASGGRSGRDGRCCEQPAGCGCGARGCGHDRGRSRWPRGAASGAGVGR